MSTMTLKSQGEIEAAVCDGISRFHQEFLGRGPRDIHAHLVGPLVVVRLQGVLTPAERRLMATSTVGEGDMLGGSDSGNGRALLKQVRKHMLVSGRPRLREIIEEATAVELVSVHHDISTLTGEELIVFSLKEPPACRAKRKVQA